MLVITKDNIIEYIKEHMPEFDDSVPVRVSLVGEGSEEEDGDGYVNYIFRVQTEKEAYVLKQALDTARVAEGPMGVYRNKLDYESMRIRYAIVPEYIPKLDVSMDELKNIRTMTMTALIQPMASTGSTSSPQARYASQRIPASTGRWS